MNETLKKRFKSGLWIILAGTVAQILTLVLENIGEFGMSANYVAILTVVLTAIVSQITKYINKRS